MRIETKSRLLVGILTLGTILGFFALTVGFTRASEIITVEPSGTGDDTANIQAAFDEAGPGDTVQLAAGQFYTNEIFVENFYGTFKGAGKDLTKIDVLRGFDPEAPGVVGPDGTPPHIFSFTGGNVHILDLSFDITPFEPAEEWIENDESFYDLLSLILIGGEINSRIENVRFTGHEGTATYEPYHPLYMVKGYNVRAGIILGIFGTLSTGRHLITNCEFNSLWLGISAYNWMYSEVKIHSNSIKGGAIGIINADSGYTKFEISGNDIEANDWGPIWALQFGPLPCQWQITHNTLRPSMMADGILLWDFSGAGALEAVIFHNKIICDTYPFYGGIWTSYVQNAFISNNIICGTGEYGIAGAYGYNNLMLGNNVQNIDAYWAPIVLLFASECIVVGGPGKTNVVDIGGYNNLIVGYNNMQGNSPGQKIQDAIEQKSELVKSFPKF